MCPASLVIGRVSSLISSVSIENPRRAAIGVLAPAPSGHFSPDAVVPVPVPQLAVGAQGQKLEKI